MTVLEELEKKVLHVIEKNKQLQITINDLTKENNSLKEQQERLEFSLLKENDLLAKEKNKVKDSIEHLLESINELEKIGS